jgi:hypothetical protein
VVTAFKVEDSKFEKKGSGKCLTVQFELNNTKHIVFTGSIGLINQIEQVPKDKFPFRAIIIRENEMFQFT